MAADPSAEAASELETEREQRVTFLELFFDLVFVFAFTQVAGLPSADPTWHGLARGIELDGSRPYDRLVRPSTARSRPARSGQTATSS